MGFLRIGRLRAAYPAAAPGSRRAAGRYVARTLEGPGAGSEIWTRLEPSGAHTRIEVDPTGEVHLLDS